MRRSTASFLLPGHSGHGSSTVIPGRGSVASRDLPAAKIEVGNVALAWLELTAIETPKIVAATADAVPVLPQSPWVGSAW